MWTSNCLNYICRTNFLILQMKFSYLVIPFQCCLSTLFSFLSISEYDSQFNQKFCWDFEWTVFNLRSMWIELMTLLYQEKSQKFTKARENLDTSLPAIQWQPTPVLLPRKSHGRRSLVGCSPWGRWESDTTERLHFHFYALEKEMTATPVFLPGESQGRGSLVDCYLWGRTESDTTEVT